MNTDNVKKIFLANLSLIILVGILFVYSSSYLYARELTGSAHYFVFKHIAYIVLGLIAAVIVSKTKFNFWYKNAYLINGAATFLLFLTLIPVIGVATKGSHRWLNIGFTTVQPGEFIKYTLGICALLYFENFESYTQKEKLQRAGCLLLPLLILLKQPDFGTFAISFSVIMFACFLSNFSRKLFYSFISVGFVGVLGLLFAAPYRVKRILVFLDPWADPLNSGFQIIQSYLAFANGGVTGQGIGNSNEKLFYLPEAYNDFIFSVLGEELGFMGVVFVVVLFAIFALFGFKLALSLKSRINSIIVSLTVFAITFQAFLNMGVVLGLLPTKGLNLPFISYGGSSIIMNLVGIGIILSNLREKSQVEENYGRETWAYNHS